MSDRNLGWLLAGGTMLVFLVLPMIIYAVSIWG